MEVRRRGRDTMEPEDIKLEPSRPVAEPRDPIVKMVFAQIEDMKRGTNASGKPIKGAELLQNASAIAGQHPAKKNSIEITRRLINEIYGKFVQLVDGQEPSAENMVFLVLNAIKLVETATAMKKGRRVELILAVLRKYIDTQPISENAKDLLGDALENALPIVYDAIGSGWVCDKIQKLWLSCIKSCQFCKK